MVTASDDRNVTWYVTFSFHLVRSAKPLDVTSCSSEQKKVLYEISNSSFSAQITSRSAYYNLIKPYLGKRACYLSLWLFHYLSEYSSLIPCFPFYSDRWGISGRRIKTVSPKHQHGHSHLPESGSYRDSCEDTFLRVDNRNGFVRVPSIYCEYVATEVMLYSN